MAIRIAGRKKHTKKFDFTQFLSGTPAGDYVFQETPYEEQIARAAKMLDGADAVLIGAGAGLSAAAGLTYGGKRFTDHFGDFIEKYGIMYMRDMYSAGFYPFPTEEAKWGYWSRHAWLNRIAPDALPLYQSIYAMVREKSHFVLTTNVDHQFWKAGFSDENIFATQGDYGKIQCKKGCHPKTYDALDMLTQMYQAEEDCLVPSYMVPRCPECGGSMTMHLRCDQYFVEDAHWNEAAGRYASFLEKHERDRVLLLEMGVGFNTPTIIRFPFEQMLCGHDQWSLVRLNRNEAVLPEHFGKRAVGINEDIAKSIADLSERVNGNDAV